MLADAHRAFYPTISTFSLAPASAHPPLPTGPSPHPFPPHPLHAPTPSAQVHATQLARGAVRTQASKMLLGKMSISSCKQYATTLFYWRIYLCFPANDGLAMTSKLVFLTFQSAQNAQRVRRGKCAAGGFLNPELAESADWE